MPDAPVYVSPSANLRGVDRVLAGTAALIVTVSAALILIRQEQWLGIAITAATLLAGWLAVLLLVPRRYEIGDERLTLRFVLGKWDIRFETIEDVRPAPLAYAYAYIGVRFATAPSRTLEVRRVRGNLFGRPNLIISPEGRDEFLRALENALGRYRGRGGGA